MSYVNSLVPASGVTVSARGCTLSGSATLGNYRAWWTYSDANNTNLTVPVGNYFNFSNACSARSNLPASMTKGASGVGGIACSDGCKFVPVGNIASVQLGSGPVYTSATSGWRADGGTCSAGDGSGEEVSADQDCTQQGSLTQCMKKDGRQCVTASSGKQFCWKQTEQGVKYSENDAAAAVQGSASINAPTTRPANGGEWTSGPSGTVTTTSGGSSTVTNILTWISSFGSEGDGKAEGDENKDGQSPTAATGAGCDVSSFQCSDMSSVECNQLIQTWYLRCKGVELNGGANCDAPPTCTGNASDCYVGQMLWNMRCEGKSDAEAGSPNTGFDNEMGAEGDGSDEPDVSNIGTGDTADQGISMWQEKDISDELSKLDASGFLSGSDQCPQLPSFKVGAASFTISMDPICSILRNVGIMVMALAYWLAIRILAKSK
ncbi:virulence factor TspB C-terminal domain-related protein [Xanthomonas massiliensis]|uniref:virulence factor TspB C-terminal domain-related protein n=1 Tax=Xanthomonas massiliensis TaxID=1720302 RepID=UPI000A4E51F8|nr:virulence factor TspB C-terminal domain-related protein [Xanthomonas massiliensis]